MSVDEESPGSVDLAATLESLFKRYVVQIGDLRKGTRETMSLVAFRSVKKHEKFQGHLKELGIEATAGVPVVFPSESARDVVFKAMQESRSAAAYTRMLPRMTMVNLVSSFETFVGRLLSVLLRENPAILHGAERTFTSKELMSYDNFEQLWEEARNKEIERILRGSHESYFTWLRKHGVDVPKGGEINEYLALVELRHLIVHQDGVISHGYLNRRRELGLSCEDLNEDDQVKISAKSLEKSFGVVIEMAGLLHVLVSRKLKLADADIFSSITHAAYDSLESDAPESARRLCQLNERYAFNNTDQMTANMLIVNNAIALEAMEKDDEREELLAAWDVVALAPVFQLAKTVLVEDWQAAAKLVVKIGADDELVTLHAYRDWPLFRKFRDTTDFLEAYLAVFGQEFKSELQLEPQDLKAGADLADNSESDSGEALSRDSVIH